jgi:hypothetical protein
MKANERGRFAKCILTLATATRGEVDEPTIEVYWRALIDVPMALIEEASIELAATAKFMPRPVEWRQAVDEVLDRRQRMQALAGPSGQALLPGEVGHYECDRCDNTGWEQIVSDCTRAWRCPQFVDGATHTHSAARRCTNRFCIEARTQAAAKKKRYAKVRE